MAISLKNREISRPKAISAAQFREWQALMGFNITEAARRLDVTRNTISTYRQEGADERVRLACRAIARAEGKSETIDVYRWEKVA